MKQLGAFAILLAVLATSAAAYAHDFRMSVLAAHERAPGHWAVTWSHRAGEPSVDAPLPERCARTSRVSTTSEASVVRRAWEMECAGGALHPDGFAVAASVEPVYVQVRDLDGRELVRIAGAAAGSEPRAVAPPAAGYLRLGVEHILAGADHVLFLVVLVLWTRAPRRLLVAVTGFTLGHSATLALVATGMLVVDSSPVEALIALSIVLVAAAALRASRSPSPLPVSERHPWLASAVFGLLHGLGFAGALGEIGLPEADRAFALVAFNAGVEVGQILVVAGVLGVLAVLRRLSGRVGGGAVVPRVVGYACGSAGVFWTLERGLAPWLG